MPAESELFKDKIEVSLDGRQIFYLFFGGAVIVALVFVLGVMVGKRVEARAHVQKAAQAPEKDPLAALDALGSGDDLAFPTALTGSREQRSAVPLGPIDEEVMAQAVPKRAQKPPAAKAKKAKKAAPKPKPKPRAKAKSPAPARPARAKAEAVAKPEARPGRARFTLQLSSFRDRAEADSFYDRLKSAGYAPYVIEAALPGKGIWYRVRLGKYHSYNAAIAAKKTFEADQHVIAYVTRLKSKK